MVTMVTTVALSVLRVCVTKTAFPVWALLEARSKHILPVAQRFLCECNACVFCVPAPWMGGPSSPRCGLCLLVMLVNALHCACCVGSSRHTRTVSPHSPPQDSPWPNLAPFTPKIPLFTLVLAVRREHISAGILNSTFNPLLPIDTPPSQQEIQFSETILRRLLNHSPPFL